jgi:hypothetical protein
MFCTQCGASNPDSASFCSACGRPMAVRPTQSDPPQQHSHMLRNVMWIAAAAAATIIAAVALSGPSLFSGPNPEDSLVKAGAAFAHRDAQAFDNYVDVQSVLGDWTDQAASSWLANNSSSVGGSLLANGIVTGFKTLILPKFVASVEPEILSNRMPDQPQVTSSGNATNYMTIFLTNSVRALIASQISYEGIASQSRSGSDAVLDVRLRSPLIKSPLLVRVGMRRSGDHWRIVSIPNVAGLLAQLQTGGNNSKVELPAAIAPTPPSPAAPTALLPAPPTAPSPADPPIASVPDPFPDDPIGPGGFITPPSSADPPVASVPAPPDDYDPFGPGGVITPPDK